MSDGNINNESGVFMVESSRIKVTPEMAESLHDAGVDVVMDADARRRGFFAQLISRLRGYRTGNLFETPDPKK